MRDTLLRLIVETPHGIILDAATKSVRLPTETGQVGLRHGHEATILAIESGLVLARTNGNLRYVGTVGGLLHSDGSTSRLLTPWGIVGNTAEGVWSSLEQALAAPSAELEARRKLAHLELSILDQMRRERMASVAVRPS